jgi:hypothetical protein
MSRGRLLWLQRARPSTTLDKGVIYPFYIGNEVMHNQTGKVNYFFKTAGNFTYPATHYQKRRELKQ